jgi:predicted ATPase
MLKRLYIDNFRCLVNFELSFDSINLLLGGNGAGKSTIFEVLWRLQSFIRGSKADSIFVPTQCTRWQTSPIQSFELEIEGNGGNYKYELAIWHDREKYRCRVQYERLWFNNQQLLACDRSGKVEIYRDDRSKNAEYLLDLSQSILPLLMAEDHNTKLTWFKQRIERLMIIQVNPSGMIDSSNSVEMLLNFNMSNYASWYRYLSQDQSNIFEIRDKLKEVLEGFDSFKFVDFGSQNYVLKVNFLEDSNTKKHEYQLGELSDGQRTLIALYTLICSTQSKDYTLCIDEPENFLALPEIQPWLHLLYDLCSEKKLQTLLISHHPVPINYLASSVGYWFTRQANTPVRVKKIGQDDNDTGLPISELVERGWLYDPV